MSSNKIFLSAITFSILGFLLFVWGTYISIHTNPTLYELVLTPQRLLMWLFFVDTIINSIAAFFILLTIHKYIEDTKNQSARIVRFALMTFFVLFIGAIVLYVIVSMWLFYGLAATNNPDLTLADDLRELIFILHVVVTMGFVVFCLTPFILKLTKKQELPPPAFFVPILLFILMGVLARFILLPQFDQIRENYLQTHPIISG